MTAECVAGCERLVELARQVDRALRRHDRCGALTGAERLLDALFDHHRAMRSLRARYDRPTADAIEVETITMIVEAALVIGQLADGRRWPPASLERDVEELISVEGRVVAPEISAASSRAAEGPRRRAS